MCLHSSPYSLYCHIVAVLVFRMLCRITQSSDAHRIEVYIKLSKREKLEAAHHMFIDTGHPLEGSGQKKVKSKQIDELNACWNNVFRKIFGYKRTESVKEVIYYLGRVNFRYLLLLRTVKFYKRLYLRTGLLHDVFWMFMSFYNDEHVRTVFIPLREAIRDLLLQFSQYVSGNV